MADYNNRWLQRLVDDPQFRERKRAQFADKVKAGDPRQCWPWLGTRSGDGYGVFFLGRSRCEDGVVRYVSPRAHRVAFVLEHGQLPQGGTVLHLCDNPICCNPRHLRAGTQLDNIADMRAKGRHSDPKREFLMGERNGRAFHTKEQALSVAAMIRAGAARRDICAKLDVDPVFVTNVRTGQAWAHVTGFAKYQRDRTRRA